MARAVITIEDAENSEFENEVALSVEFEPKIDLSNVEETATVAQAMALNMVSRSAAESVVLSASAE